LRWSRAERAVLAAALTAAGIHLVLANIFEAGGRTAAAALGGAFLALDVADEAVQLEYEALVKRKHGGLDVAVLALRRAGLLAPRPSLS
jgi:hypothetical protein